MAAARRIPITTLSSYSALNNPSESDLPHGAGLHTPPAPSPPAEQTLRIELVLFEPDDTRFAEFRYPQLAEATVNNRREKALNDELKDEDDDDLQKKNSETRKLKTERVAELVDLGYGYDDTDSFIDNSEPYDEFVPVSLNTQYGGFYINVGILQFRAASGDENQSDDFQEMKPKKRKLKEDELKTSKKKKRKENVQPKGENLQHSVSVDKKKKVKTQQQNFDDMLRKFHKEKLQELQLFNRQKESPPAFNSGPSDLTASSSRDPTSAVGDADDFYPDGLQSIPQNRQSSLPEAFPSAVEQSDGLLAVLIRKLEEAVVRVMPEQMERYNHHCQAHSEARATKLEAVKEKRAGEGSDEDENDTSGKRVFAPRKRFRWNEEIRAVLCEVVSLKMLGYEQEAAADQTLEDYLKCFLEARVKTLWPRGWMQSRILLIESRRVHAHVTGVVVRRRTLTAPKTEKVQRGAGVCPGRKLEELLPVQTVSSTEPQSGAVCEDVSIPQPEVVSGVESDVYFPPNLPLPFTPAVAAMEGSCGDPALPTPSLSHQTYTPPPESGLFPAVAPPQALPLPEPAGHMEICTASSLHSTSAASGTFRYTLA